MPFNPDFPTTAATVVLLVLVTATIDSRLLEYWTPTTKSGQEDRRTLARIYVGTIGFVMLTSGFYAVIASLVELNQRTNSLDTPIFICTVIVVVGMALSFFSRLFRALFTGPGPISKFFRVHGQSQPTGTDDPEQGTV